ncbi:hypothetical protein FHX64_002937 [Microbacter margulisiae]|uniref:Uncharacterized protein n=1 Tax=Microbacter margulisiae TaxID=1350067 RepID=A0A7W5H3L0_9PORP|nr:hypothetical protein [Microbacter margulisiae]MBB3186226.1 hypothetical protein [Microbacter margulisiae]MBB3186292.1 hypothetical protein [Microbacter margulisiae]MBB3186910.1 hypothetical protein [Microbacter margulisiae]MBB3187306.1 hypothetical protein [Microbacter margulisiae]
MDNEDPEFCWAKTVRGRPPNRFLLQWHKVSPSFCWVEAKLRKMPGYLFDVVILFK